MTSTPTPLPPYTVRVRVYNEAGELVKQVLVEQRFDPATNINLASGKTITTLNGAGNKVDIYDGNSLLATWNGDNSNGSPVANGVYHIQVDTFDPLGLSSSVSQPVMVDRAVAKVSVAIYNEAGEVVKHLYQLMDDPLGSRMTNVTLSSYVIRPGTIVAAGQPASVQIVVQASGTPMTLTWDGTSDNGAIVTAGHYQMGVHWDNGLGGVTDITRGILVTSGSVLDSITAQPNILSPVSGMLTTFKVNSNQDLSVGVKVYTAAGEWVAGVEGAPGTNQVLWNAAGLASGLYLAVVEVSNDHGGVVQRQIRKVEVVR